MRSALGLFGFAVLFVSQVSAAAPVAPPVDRPLRAGPDVVLRDAPRTPLTLPIVPSAQWLRVSSLGVVIAGQTTTLTNGVLEGDAGKAYLYPGHIPVPVFDISDRGTEFSPDGRYLLVASNQSFTRQGRGGPAIPPHPSTVVLRLPDLQVMQRFVGFDPQWIGPTTAMFRRGSQSYRVEVGHEPVAVGVPQPAFGCTVESFGPETPCRGNMQTNLLTQDPRQTFWVTETYFGGLVDQGRFEHVDVLDLATGSSRKVFEIADPGNRLGLSLWSSGSSPNALRNCAWREAPAASELLCVSLPNGQPERLLTLPKRPESWVWLDDQRYVFRAGSQMEVIDFAANTRSRVLGLPAGVAGLTLLPGGRVAFNAGTVRVLDFTAGTSSDLGVTTAYHVVPVPRIGGGFYLSTRQGPLKYAFTWVGA